MKFTDWHGSNTRVNELEKSLAHDPVAHSAILEAMRLAYQAGQDDGRRSTLDRIISYASKPQ